MPVYDNIIGPNPKFIYYLLKGSSLKKAAGRGRGPEAMRLVKVGRGAFYFSFPNSCQRTRKRLIED
jgi:hypothetical protein